MTSIIIGAIRTLAAAAAGWVGTWFIQAVGTEIDTAALEGFLFAAVTGLYYLAVRLLAERWPIFGNLFVINKAPSYEGEHRA
jgi:hypothetical protein